MLKSSFSYSFNLLSTWKIKEILNLLLRKDEVARQDDVKKNDLRSLEEGKLDVSFLRLGVFK